MNIPSDSALVSELRNLSVQSEAARNLFESFADRKNDARETTVERAANLASSDYATMIAIFKDLDEAGVGNFIVGRHGYPSRIEWSYSIRSLGEIVRGQQSTPSEVDHSSLADDDDEIASSAILTHSFRLREGHGVSMQLPADLTEKEAERLASFIRTLPF